MSGRPLSPHLQVYRLPLTAMVSITHRATGAVLTLGMVLLAVGLMRASEGADAYLQVQNVLRSWPGQVIVWGWIYSLSFHFCHGIRHLVWDVGYSFDKMTLTRYALVELGASVLLTVLAYLLS